MWPAGANSAVSVMAPRAGSGMAVCTDSYRALVERVRELDGAVLSAEEAQRVRDAADARLFGDEDQNTTVELALALLDRCVEAARLSSRTRRQLSDLLSAIEPFGTGA